MSQTVSAFYDNHSAARRAIATLEANGFGTSDLSILASESSLHNNIKLEEHSKAPEGISIGAGIGAAAGAAIAGLTAIGTITLTGGAAILAAGPIVAAFAGAGAGAGAGGLIGGLIGLGMPETEAKMIEDELGQGHVMLGVSVDDNDDKEQVQNLLKGTNPEKITIH